MDWYKDTSPTDSKYIVKPKRAQKRVTVDIGYTLLHIWNNTTPKKVPITEQLGKLDSNVLDMIRWLVTAYPNRYLQV